MSDAVATAGIVIEILPEDDNLVATVYEIDSSMSVEEQDGLVTLSLVPVLNDKEILGDTYIDGEIAFNRTIEIGNRAGLRAANALMRQTEKIPDGWKDKCFVFTGTAIRNKHNEFYIVYVQWNIYTSRWMKNLCFLDCGWREDSQMVQMVAVN